MTISQDELFTMANLSPLFTGLPFVVWISPRNTLHDIRVKISRGMKAIPENFITVALRPDLRVIGDDKLSADEMQLLSEWVALNWNVLLAYWNSEIFTEQAVSALQPIRNVKGGPEATRQ